MYCVRDFLSVQCADIVLGRLHGNTKNLLQIAVCQSSGSTKLSSMILC